MSDRRATRKSPKEQIEQDPRTGADVQEILAKQQEEDEDDDDNSHDSDDIDDVVGGENSESSEDSDDNEDSDDSDDSNSSNSSGDDGSVIPITLGPSLHPVANLECMPNEILLLICQQLVLEPDRPGTLPWGRHNKHLYDFCLVSRKFASIGLPYLYEVADFKNGKQQIAFAHTVLTKPYLALMVKKISFCSMWPKEAADAGASPLKHLVLGKGGRTTRSDTRNWGMITSDASKLTAIIIERLLDMLHNLEDLQVPIHAHLEPSVLNGLTRKIPQLAALKTLRLEDRETHSVFRLLRLVLPFLNIEQVILGYCRVAPPISEDVHVYSSVLRLELWRCLFQEVDMERVCRHFPKLESLIYSTNFFPRRRLYEHRQQPITAQELIRALRHNRTTLRHLYIGLKHDDDHYFNGARSDPIVTLQEFSKLQHFVCDTYDLLPAEVRAGRLQLPSPGGQFLHKFPASLQSFGILTTDDAVVQELTRLPLVQDQLPNLSQIHVPKGFTPLWSNERGPTRIQSHLMTLTPKKHKRYLKTLQASLGTRLNRYTCPAWPLDQGALGLW